MFAIVVILAEAYSCVIAGGPGNLPMKKLIEILNFILAISNDYGHCQKDPRTFSIKLLKTSGSLDFLINNLCKQILNCLHNLFIEKRSILKYCNK